MFARPSMRGNHYYSSCVQCLGVSGTVQHLLRLLRERAMILPFSHSTFLHWSTVCRSLTPFHDEPKHIYWAPSRRHGPERGQTSPPEAGASSPGCSANCSVLSWPHTAAPRKEQDISFLNIKPSVTFLITSPTRRLIPAALSPGYSWKPLIYFWYVTKQLHSAVLKVRFSKASERAEFFPSAEFVEKT